MASEGMEREREKKNGTNGKNHQPKTKCHTNNVQMCNLKKSFDLPANRIVCRSYFQC